jgi:hypothetical protein
LLASEPAAMQQLHMSARAYHRILKLARTIADLAGSEEIQAAHLAKATHCPRFSIGRDGKLDLQVAPGGIYKLPLCV